MQSVKAWLVTTTLLCASVLTAQPSGARVVMGPLVRVSRARSADTHYEVIAAAHRTDPRRLIVGSIIYSAGSTAVGTIVYASRDGGTTWQPALDGAALAQTGDPACAFAGDGSAYYVTSFIPASGERSMLLYRSRDGGSTWEAPTALTYMDRQYVTVDATEARTSGRVYVNGNNRVPRGISDYVVFASTDSGRSFRGPARRPEFGRASVPVMGNSVVMSDGTLVGIFVQTDGASPRATLRAVHSTDGGSTLGESFAIDEIEIGGSRKGENNNVNSEPIIAVDESRGRFRDRLYVVWPDRRSGQSRILFASSGDGGRTWAPARAINDNPPDDHTDQFMPTIAVNRDGAIGVIWYDRRDNPDNLGWDVRFTASLDGGATFLPSVKVSGKGTRFDDTTPWTALRSTVDRTPSGLRLRVSLNNFMFLGGDTDGLAADASGVFHPFWVDNSAGVPQVWTASVKLVPPTGKRAALPRASAQSPRRSPVESRRAESTAVEKKPRPSVALAGDHYRVTDISSDVTIEVASASYDRRRNVLSVRARLRNVSAATLAGPFEIRAGDVRSERGDASALGDDAVWRFPEGRLAPSAVTEEQSIQFVLSALRPFRGEGRSHLGLVDARLVVGSLR